MLGCGGQRLSMHAASCRARLGGCSLFQGDSLATNASGRVSRALGQVACMQHAWLLQPAVPLPGATARPQPAHALHVHPKLTLSCLAMYPMQAISQAIAVINTIAQTSTSYEDVQRATQVALTTLSADVQEMLATGDVAAFTARTSEASLRSAVTAATLAGNVQAPASEDDGGSSNKVGQWLIAAG